MTQEALRAVNTMANVINAVVILVLVGLLIRSKNQMAQAMGKLAEALADQVRTEKTRSRNVNENLRNRAKNS